MSRLPAISVKEDDGSPSRLIPLVPLALTRQPPVEVDPTYWMGGVPVYFPLKGYKSQVAIMSKLITSAQKQQHCLLESPTGSGKTLALLCGALAWQANEIAKIRKLKDELIRESSHDESMYSEEGWSQMCQGEEPKKCSFCTTNAAAAAALPVPQPEAVVIDLISEDGAEDFSDDDDFKPAKKRCKGVTFLESKPSVKREPAPVVNPGSCTCKDSVNDLYNRIRVEENWDEVENAFPQIPKIPKIFYGTRTHKQIEQVVKELKNTHYNTVKMSILASREHNMCIHPKGSFKSYTELCNDLLDPRTGAGCCFKQNVDRIGTHEALYSAGCSTIFDIEELASIGSKAKACPYFTSRSLVQKGAELIFCPYNYLIDPHIRESMQLNLTGSVIILDEGHNIEDVAKESASYSITKGELEEAAKDCMVTAINGRLREDHTVLELFLKEVLAWIDGQDSNLQSSGDFNSMSKTFTGIEAIASFENHGTGLAAINKFKFSVANVINDMMAPPKQNEVIKLPMIHATTKMVLTGLQSVFDNLYFNEMARAVDYHVNVSKVLQNHQMRQSTYGRWKNMSSEAQHETSWQYSLHFWCLNPAVAMESLSQVARSIVLTSGTLSPMDSFSSELGINFSMKFEADHVIKSNQVFVRSISHGPQGKSLNAQYKNTQTFDFLDELGLLVLNVCQIVKYGVLCFFPSYRLLETCYKRWEQTGLKNQLEQHKLVLCEPKRGDQLTEVMEDFRTSVRDPAFLGSRYFSVESVAGTMSARSGPLLFAVYRGKVSEGMDFANNDARAVIAIGIPYPAYKDVKVEMKRAYNDLHSKTRGLLTGSRWYDIQAYRALNQALGRCIRHRSDWGAILLVDDRYGRGPYYTNGLSKWIKKELKHYNQCNALLSDLHNFVEERTSSMNIDQQEQDIGISLVHES